MRGTSTHVQFIVDLFKVFPFNLEIDFNSVVVRYFTKQEMYATENFVRNFVARFQPVKWEQHLSKSR